MLISRYQASAKSGICSRSSDVQCLPVCVSGCVVAGLLRARTRAGATADRVALSASSGAGGAAFFLAAARWLGWAILHGPQEAPVHERLFCAAAQNVAHELEEPIAGQDPLLLNAAQRAAVFWLTLGVLIGIVIGPAIDLLWAARRCWARVIHVLQCSCSGPVADRRILRAT